MNSNSYLNSSTIPSCSSPPWLGLSILLLAGFVTIFDLFVVNIAIPSMQTGLDASFAQINFIIVGYELAFGVLLITGGRLGDLFGRRRLFIIGMVGFTLASLLCGIAPNANFLIGARIIQGLAAALLFPQLYASIRINFNGNDSRRAFGLLGMTLGLAAIAGQVLGGWLLYANLFGLGWRNIFLINIPIGLFAMVMARWIPESYAPQRPNLDWAGVILISLGLILLLVPLIEGSGQDWPMWIFCSLGMALLLFVFFYHHQKRYRIAGKLPLVDIRLFKQQHFTLGSLLVLLVYSTSSSFFLCFALLIQTGLNINPFMAGIIFAPCSIGFVVASLVAPRLVTRWGTHAILIGALVYAISIGLLITQVWIAGVTLIPTQMIPLLIVVGIGQGFIMTPLLNLVLGFVDEAQAGMASGIISTVQQIGAALGVAMVGILFSRELTSKLSKVDQAGQYTTAFVTGMLYNLIAALLVCVLLFMLAKVKHPVNS